MNKDNFSALVMAIGVVSLIVGFAIYFNSAEVNKVVSVQGGTTNFVPIKEYNNNDTTTTIKNAQFSIDKSQFKKAPEFEKVSGYINSKPLNLSDLKGKVVLVDFWTYSCINCIRTIPYLVDWNEKYADKGLVIVGVHTPEFEFEKNIDNVKEAVKKFGIKYPVIQDNDKGTWNAYQNQYWPRKYIVDSEGYLRYDHIGEGGYVETEKVIQNLLQERIVQMGLENNPSSINNSTVTEKITIPENVQSVDYSKINSPELYFGYQFARASLGNPEGFKPDQTVNYSLANTGSNIKPNVLYLDGTWKNNADNMELQSNTGRIALVYSAKSVNMVAGGNGEVLVLEDGSTLQGKYRGADLSEEGRFAIGGQRLYNLSMHDNYGLHSIVIDVKGKGFQAYTFTFG
ncbi:MAG TPA: thioredoxin family protein [Nitrososphaeraceae archaeon]|nr:thioredoxin family protein [Nitrososphaeraceae archaeon]